MSLRTNLQAVYSAPNQDRLPTVTQLAHAANRLAKRHTGRDQQDLYAMKDFFCSVLILDEGAVVNGTQSKNRVGITTRDRSKIHVDIPGLRPKARELARVQSRFAPATGPVSDRVDSKTMTALLHLVRRNEEED